MNAILKEIKWVDGQDVLYTLECPEIASAAQPGQFVQVKVSPGQEPLLRRPFSIFSADRQNFKILVRMVGKGTRLMTGWAAGDEIDILGPLGRGYTWQNEDVKVILVAGGIGVAPLNFLAEKLVDDNKNVHILFTPRRQELLLNEMSVMNGMKLKYAENRGQVTGILEDMLEDLGSVDRIFTCGPNGLMESVVNTGLKHKISTQVSMEEQMACGIGICLGCAVPIKTASGFVYKKACHDGPVFNGEEVLFNEQS